MEKTIICQGVELSYISGKVNQFGVMMHYFKLDVISGKLSELFTLYQHVNVKLPFWIGVDQGYILNVKESCLTRLDFEYKTKYRANIILTPYFSESKALKGLDSLLSIAQMPYGIPVGTMAIGEAGAINAALMAIAILARYDDKLAVKLHEYRKKQTQTVMDMILPDIDSFIG